MSEHKIIVKKFIDAVNSRDLEVLVDFMVTHHRRELGYDGWSKLLNDAEFKEYFQGFSDLKISIDDGWILEEGEKCITIFHISGTNDGLFFGLPPKGITIDDTGRLRSHARSIRSEYKGGKLNLIQINWDLLLLFIQLGVSLTDIVSSGNIPQASEKSLQDYIRQVQAKGFHE